MKTIKFIISFLAYFFGMIAALSIVSHAIARDKPYPTQKDRKDWVSKIDPKEAEILRSLDGHWRKQMAMWESVLERQPVTSYPREVNIYDLIAVNKMCNSVFKVDKYNFLTAKDIIIWGKEDYWATPSEFIAKGKGDCEEFAICKYYKLRKLGFKPEQLNIWSGTLANTMQHHAILAVEIDGREYVLDNLNRDVLLVEEYMNEYFWPKYRLNENGWSIF